MCVLERQKYKRWRGTKEVNGRRTEGAYSRWSGTFILALLLSNISEKQNPAKSLLFQEMVCSRYPAGSHNPAWTPFIICHLFYHGVRTWLICSLVYKLVILSSSRLSERSHWEEYCWAVAAGHVEVALIKHFYFLCLTLSAYFKSKNKTPKPDNFRTERDCQITSELTLWINVFQNTVLVAALLKCCKLSTMASLCHFIFSLVFLFSSPFLGNSFAMYFGKSSECSQMLLQYSRKIAALMAISTNYTTVSFLYGTGLIDIWIG